MINLISIYKERKLRILMLFFVHIICTKYYDFIIICVQNLSNQLKDDTCLCGGWRRSYKSEGLLLGEIRPPIALDIILFYFLIANGPTTWRLTIVNL